MTNPQDVRSTLQHFADNIGRWRAEAGRLRARTEQQDTASTELLVHVEDTAGDIYREIESFDIAVADVAKQSPQAAGELAEVGEILRLLLLDITELGTKLYSTRAQLREEPS
jgi:hypothetical protein